MDCRIMLVDDHKIFRADLRVLIERREGFAVVAEACDGRSALQLFHEVRPDIVVMDILMPKLNGIEATRSIMETAPFSKIVVLSMMKETQFISSAFEAGASAYLLKDCVLEDLMDALHSVLDNQVYLSPQIEKAQLDLPLGPALQSCPLSDQALNCREQQIIRLAARGLNPDQIGDSLGISPAVMQNHYWVMMNKLHLADRYELNQWISRHIAPPCECRHSAGGPSPGL